MTTLRDRFRFIQTRGAVPPALESVDVDERSTSIAGAAAMQGPNRDEARSSR